MSLQREQITVRNNINYDKKETIITVTSEPLDEQEKELISKMKRDDAIKYIKEIKHGNYIDVRD